MNDVAGSTLFFIPIAVWWGTGDWKLGLAAMGVAVIFMPYQTVRTLTMFYRLGGKLTLVLAGKGKH